MDRKIERISLFLAVLDFEERAIGSLEERVNEYILLRTSPGSVVNVGRG